MSATTNAMHKVWGQATASPDYRKSDWGTLQHEVEQLEAENKRLREALAEVIADTNRGCQTPTQSLVDRIRDMVRETHPT